MSQPAPAHALCMIPGPVEFHEDVLAEMGAPAVSHVAPGTIEAFREVLHWLGPVFGTAEAQPLVVAGSGTLGWDMTAANLIEPGQDRALVVNTGYFGDHLGDCLAAYGAAAVDHVRAAEVGGAPTVEDVARAVEAHPAGYYKLVTITHVDTSTGVRVPALANMVAAVRRASPETLVMLDGVCSVGGEDVQMDAWGVDVVVTASQKALGVPPGLLVMMMSPRALAAAAARKQPVRSYFGNWARWLPIMEAYAAGRPSYFATPPVQLLLALRASLRRILFAGAAPPAAVPDAAGRAAAVDAMRVRVAQHRDASLRVKAQLRDWGLRLVPVAPELAADTLTAVYYPDSVIDAGRQRDFIAGISKRGAIVATGLHKAIAPRYFRIGHMNLSAVDSSLGHISTTLEAIHGALADLECLS